MAANKLDPEAGSGAAACFSLGASPVRVLHLEGNWDSGCVSPTARGDITRGRPPWLARDTDSGGPFTRVPPHLALYNPIDSSNSIACLPSGDPFSRSFDAETSHRATASEVAAQANVIWDMASDVWKFAESGFEENQSAAYEAAVLDKNGFKPLENINLIADPDKNFVVIMEDGKIYKNTVK